MSATSTTCRVKDRGSLLGINTRLLRRRMFDILGWGFCSLAFLLLGSAMVSIFLTVLIRGIGALSLQVVTHVTSGTSGGLLNAIEGTLVLAVGGVLLAVPPGLAAGIYLSMFDTGALAPTIRFLSDVLVGVPSIVIGYFGYITMVVSLGWQFSAAAGSLALAIICMPYICRTSEMAINQVPRGVRESAYALGAGDGRVAMGICVRMALPGIITGILLALAISVGETAPLLYTAGWSNYMWNGHLIREPIGYLTYAIWAFITEPFSSAHALAYAAALFIILFILAISMLSRMVIAGRGNVIFGGKKV